MQEAAEQYNGWSNYETWCVALWLDNDESSYRYWRTVAAETRREANNCRQPRSDRWSEQEAARFKLAELLKDEVSDASPLTEPSLYSDLLSAALSEVDWLEIADSILQS